MPAPLGAGTRRRETEPPCRRKGEREVSQQHDATGARRDLARRRRLQRRQGKSAGVYFWLLRRRAHLAGDLGRHGVRLADLVPPVATANRHDVQLGGDDGTADGGGHLLRALNAEADVAVEVAHNDEGLRESSPERAGCEYATNGRSGATSSGQDILLAKRGAKRQLLLQAELHKPYAPAMTPLDVRSVVTAAGERL